MLLRSIDDRCLFGLLGRDLRFDPGLLGFGLFEEPRCFRCGLVLLGSLPFGRDLLGLGNLGGLLRFDPGLLGGLGLASEASRLRCLLGRPALRRLAFGLFGLRPFGRPLRLELGLFGGFSLVGEARRFRRLGLLCRLLLRRIRLLGRPRLLGGPRLFGCDQLGALSPREIRIGTVRVKVEKYIPGIDGRAALEQFVVAPRLGIGVNRNVRCRNERDGAAAERPVDKRLLSVCSRLQDVVADLAERAGRGQAWQDD